MKILVTDDSKMARKMVIKTLKDVIGENAEIIEAQNGLESFDLYKEHLPKIVFMDLTMPIMDGFEALEKIKEFDENAKSYNCFSRYSKTVYGKSFKIRSI